jgi:DNA-binding response OmpR family regulator
VSGGPLVWVVDDEPDLREMLADYLGGFDCRVEGFADPAALRAALALRRPDVVVLDVNMPGEDGFRALAALRAGCFADLPVIMLTAVGGTASRVAGLDGGADDFLVKPFELRELLARIRAVLARCPRPAGGAGQARRSLPFGPCRVDLDGRRLLDHEDREVPLTALEFELVQTFAERPDRVLGRDQLAHGADSGNGDRRLDVRVARLRGKLAAIGCGGLIRTVRGEGYMFTHSAEGH